ncbi:hypothetical protein NCC78_09875 [Micromonospora phytophila]|uniref:hypothetical protein n=1 Tax=Micromonospora phytophila TaxID=709888 RepID=UPI0020309D92|nr:hypothetical protein [Micromonospora phytophila]MCM0674994.1 hypothetical protein [Micromonospora phytophila]
MERVNRAQFHAALAPLSQDQLRKVLWTLYWRGPAAVRERIEAELIPNAPAPRPARADPAPDQVLAEIRQFAALARGGSYLAGDRRVKPSERTRWRFTFKRLVTQARDALRVDATGDGATGMEILIDLACEMRDHDYFRSEDPVEAAGLVVSDEVALLWTRLRDRLDPITFAQRTTGS